LVYNFWVWLRRKGGKIYWCKGYIAHLLWIWLFGGSVESIDRLRLSSTFVAFANHYPEQNNDLVLGQNKVRHSPEHVQQFFQSKYYCVKIMCEYSSLCVFRRFLKWFMGYSSLIIPVLLFQSYYSSLIIPVLLFQSYYSSLIIPVLLFQSLVYNWGLIRVPTFVIVFWCLPNKTWCFTIINPV